MDTTLARRCLAEFVGTAALLLAIVGSGIAAQHLAPGQVGLQLAMNAAVTGLSLAAIISAVGPVSGAHLNPVVSIADRLFGGLSTAALGAYSAAQVSGAIAGTVAANVMFSLVPVSIASQVRGGSGQLFSEVLTTFGLLVVIFSMASSTRQTMAPFAIGAYITSAIIWSSSASFANPAVTIGRMFTDTFSGIAPASVPAFVVAQLVGMAVAVAAVRALFPTFGSAQAKRLVLAHDDTDEGQRPSA